MDGRVGLHVAASPGCTLPPGREATAAAAVALDTHDEDWPPMAPSRDKKSVWRREEKGRRVVLETQHADRFAMTQRTLCDLRLALTQEDGWLRHRWRRGWRSNTPRSWSSRRDHVKVYDTYIYTSHQPFFFMIVVDYNSRARYLHLKSILKREIT